MTGSASTASMRPTTCQHPAAAPGGRRLSGRRRWRGCRSGDPAIIKQYLDIGFKTLLVPMVESAEQAGASSRPPAFRRAASGASPAPPAAPRASAPTPTISPPSMKEVCLIVQIESRAALHDLDAIAAVDGIDGSSSAPPTSPARSAISASRVTRTCRPRSGSRSTASGRRQARRHPVAGRSRGAPLPGHGRDLRCRRAGHQPAGEGHVALAARFKADATSAPASKTY